MAGVNQTRPHSVNQMGKTHSKPLAARHGWGTAWARHGYGMLCVNRPQVRNGRIFFMHSAMLVTDINDDNTETHLGGYPTYTAVLLAGSVTVIRHNLM